MSSPLIVDCVCNPGTKFIVADYTANKAFPPGSLGFISNYGGQFRTFPNTILAEAIIIRRGKKGKDRLERATFATPVFDTGPRVTESKYRGYNFVYTESTGDVYKSVLDMPELDFLGWSLAYCHHLTKLFREMTNRWPKEKYHPVNALKRAPGYFNEDPASIANFCALDFAETLITEMRNLESLALRAATKQIAGITLAKLKALLYFMWMNVHCKRNKLEPTFPQAEVLTSVEHHLKVLQQNQKREFELDQKRFEAYSKGKKKVDPLLKPVKPQLPRKVADIISLLEDTAKMTEATPNFNRILFDENKKQPKVALHEMGQIII